MKHTFDLSMLTRRNVPRRTFDAGEKVFLEQEAGSEMFAVLSGRVDVLTFGKMLESVGPGGIFGEMALIDKGPRCAAALAAEPTEVAVIGKELFLTLVHEEPSFALYVMQTLVRRLRASRPASSERESSV